MLCAFFLVVLAVAVVVVATRPNLRRSVFGVAGKPAGPAAPRAASAPGRTPQTLEGVLTRQLVTGEITGPQYRHAMASIAIRDAGRHPFEVPPDVEPPETIPPG